MPQLSAVRRSAVVTVEVTTVLVASHTAAGGGLPSAAWIVAMALTVFGAGVLVLDRRVRPAVALPALVVVQLGLHAYLAALSTAPGTGAMSGMGHEHLAPSAHHAGVLPLPMLVAHVVGALVTAALWELRARVAGLVQDRPDGGLLPLPALRRPAPEAPSCRRGAGLESLLAAPRRGPPPLPARA